MADIQPEVIAVMSVRELTDIKPRVLVLDCGSVTNPDCNKGKEAVAQAMTVPMPHHRTDEFVACMQRTQEDLQKIYRTKDPVLLLSSSGSGAMEAAVVNLTRPAETVLYAGGGKFAERWGELLRVFGRCSRDYRQLGRFADAGKRR